MRNTVQTEGNHIVFVPNEHLVPVRVISMSGVVALVEYYEDGVAQRVYLPMETVNDNHCSESDLRLGARYGLDWEDILSSISHITADTIAQALRRHGIWTADDLYRNVDKARAAWQEALGTDIAKVISEVRAKERAVK